MYGHGANPILFNNKKEDWRSPTPSLQSGCHICIAPYRLRQKKQTLEVLRLLVLFCVFDTSLQFILYVNSVEKLDIYLSRLIVQQHLLISVITLFTLKFNLNQSNLKSESNLNNPGDFSLYHVLGRIFSIFILEVLFFLNVVQTMPSIGCLRPSEPAGSPFYQ